MTGPAKRGPGEGSIFPRGNGYAGYVWITTPAGRRQRKYVYGKTREEVHQKYLELHRRAALAPVAASVPNLETYLTYWLSEVIAPNRAPLTHATYETLCRLYIVPGLGNRRLDKLGVRDIQAWLKRTQETCSCCAQGKDARRPERRRKCCAIGRCCGSRPSARTVRDLRTVLRSALNSAIAEELIGRNPATLVKMPSQRKRKKRAWTTEEARAFLESARAEGDRLYAAYALILTLGLRKGEVLGLRWESIDFERHEVTIDQQVQRVRRQLLQRETKTAGSDSELPLPELCAVALRQRCTDQHTEMQRAAQAWNGDSPGTGLVFTGKYGAPIDPRTVNRMFARRCVEAGVRNITVHEARKTCATMLVDLEVHPRVVMQILRHAQISVTMEIYAQASSPATREALRRLGESLTSQPDPR